MGNAKSTGPVDRLSRLLEQCELLPGRLDMRQVALDGMRSLSLRIDAAYDSFARGLKTPADQQGLTQTQSAIQALIEGLRSEADAITTQWWEVHNAVGDELAAAAPEPDVFLPALEGSGRLPTPSSSNSKLQVLQLRELLRRALLLPNRAAPVAAPTEPRATSQECGGLLTAKDIAATSGISDKTICRYAKQGRIPYVHIQSSHRFRQADIGAWLEAKSFQPAGMKKPTAGKKTVPRTVSDR